MGTDKMAKGLFITFEGCDGMGKSTQVGLVAEILRKLGYNVLTSREPGGTSLAETVRSIVLNPDLPLNNVTQTLLFLAARSEHVEKVLRPAKESGKIVLCDRFSDSTIAYQGYAQEKSEAEIDSLKQQNAFATGNFVPDLTLLFDADPKEILVRRNARADNDRFENAGLEFQYKLRNGFLKLAQEEPERFIIVDALQEKNTVTEFIVKSILDI